MFVSADFSHNTIDRGIQTLFISPSSKGWEVPIRCQHIQCLMQVTLLACRWLPLISSRGREENHLSGISSYNPTHEGCTLMVLFLLNTITLEVRVSICVFFFFFFLVGETQTFSPYQQGRIVSFLFSCSNLTQKSSISNPSHSESGLMVLPSSRTLTVSVKGSQRSLVSSTDDPTGGWVEREGADVIGQQEVGDCGETWCWTGR